LFDQGGGPLLTLPTYVYEEDFNSSRETFDYPDGAVTFERDQNGRIIPNLYPLELSTYDSDGRLVPVPRPSIGFPGIEARVESSSVTTTMVSGP
jgi:hypothetical protein